MTRRRLDLLVLGEISGDPELPGWLERKLARALELRVRRPPPLPLSREWSDPASGRLSSNAVVDALAAWVDPRAWTLALLQEDLFAPGREFVFGEATVGGPVALLSLHRLHDPDTSVLRRRALTEAVHEIGHLARLGHCDDPGCVMAESVRPADVDRKEYRFCAACTDRFAAFHPP